jgi:uncharacterized protein YodC (DUF2158 family)
MAIGGRRFRTGDQVRLRSGGPDMTVLGYNAMLGYECAWFAGAVNSRAWFPQDALCISNARDGVPPGLEDVGSLQESEKQNRA